jgi:hypothetical protein
MVSYLVPDSVRLTGADPEAVYVTGTGTDNSEAAGKSLFRILWDDADRSLCPFYDDSARWPGSFPYPVMPFFTDIATTTGLRFTQMRGVARCSPRRAADLSGRHGHISPEHPFGTGVGDVPGQTPATQTPFWRGLQPDHRPWPKVLKEAGAPHKTWTGPKFHLYERTEEGQIGITDLAAAINIAGFDHSLQSSLSGDGEPTYGYYGFQWSEYDTDGTSSSGTLNPAFNPTWVYDRMISWVDDQLSAEDPKPIVVNYWTNLPHGNPPAFEQLVGPAGEQVHTTYTYDEHIPNTTSADGKVLASDPRVGYDAAGVFWDGGVGAGGSDVIEDFLYTFEGAVPVFFRRTVSLYEAADFYSKLAHDYIRDTYPDAYANMLFVMDSDNGSDPGALAEIETTVFAGLGAEYANVFPPTSTGAVGGDLYHNPAEAKGSSKDQGILSPLMVWGAQLPAARMGTDCDATLDATDFYPTYLDYLWPGQWQDALGADLAKLDGTSFWPRILDGARGDKIFSYHRVQKPGWVENADDYVHQFDACVVSNRPGEIWKWRGVFEREYASDGAGSGTSAGTLLIAKHWELYDLVADPAEETDLRQFLDNPAYPLVTAAINELSPLYLAMFGVH